MLNIVRIVKSFQNVNNEGSKLRKLMLKELFSFNIRFHRIKSIFASEGIASIVLTSSSPGVLPINTISDFVFVAEQQVLRKTQNNSTVFWKSFFNVAMPFL